MIKELHGLLLEAKGLARKRATQMTRDELFKMSQERQRLLKYSLNFPLTCSYFIFIFIFIVTCRPQSAEDKIGEEVTNSLKRMLETMRAEVDKSVTNISTAKATTTKLEGTNENYKQLSGTLDESRSLIRELWRRDRSDMIYILGAVGIFVATVVYIVVKRMPGVVWIPGQIIMSQLGKIIARKPVEHAFVVDRVPILEKNEETAPLMNIDEIAIEYGIKDEARIEALDLTTKTKENNDQVMLDEIVSKSNDPEEISSSTTEISQDSPSESVPPFKFPTEAAVESLKAEPIPDDVIDEIEQEKISIDVSVPEVAPVSDNLVINEAELVSPSNQSENTQTIEAVSSAAESEDLVKVVSEEQEHSNIIDAQKISVTPSSEEPERATTVSHSHQHIQVTTSENDAKINSVESDQVPNASVVTPNLAVRSIEDSGTTLNDVAVSESEPFTTALITETSTVVIPIENQEFAPTDTIFEAISFHKPLPIPTDTEGIVSATETEGNLETVTATAAPIEVTSTSTSDPISDISTTQTGQSTTEDIATYADMEPTVKPTSPSHQSGKKVYDRLNAPIHPIEYDSDPGTEADKDTSSSNWTFSSDADKYEL